MSGLWIPPHLRGPKKTVEQRRYELRGTPEKGSGRRLITAGEMNQLIDDNPDIVAAIELMQRVEGHEKAALTVYRKRLVSDDVADTHESETDVVAALQKKNHDDGYLEREDRRITDELIESGVVTEEMTRAQ